MVITKVRDDILLSDAQAIAHGVAPVCTENLIRI